MLSASQFPAEARAVAEHAFSLSAGAQTPGTPRTFCVAVRRGATALLEACRDAGIEVRVLTANMLGREVVNGIARTLPPALGALWRSLPVAVVGHDEGQGAKTLARAGVSTELRPAPHDALGDGGSPRGEEIPKCAGGDDGARAGQSNTFPRRTVVVFDDDPLAWNEGERHFVWKVKRYDLLRPMGEDALRFENGYLERMRGHLAKLHSAERKEETRPVATGGPGA
jgi:hypothetical protein